MRIFILLKKNLLTIIFGAFMIFLILFSKNNLNAAKDGLYLWATCVVPSLFPFFIATELLNYTNIASMFGKLLNKFMRPIFNIPGEGAYAFIMGIISGYPVGAKIVCDFYTNGICTKEECERILAFTNNSGPLFIIGTVGIMLLGNTSIGILLFFTHLLSSISVGIIFGIVSRRFKIGNGNSKNHVISKPCQNQSFSELGNILSISIQKAVATIFLVGGFVVLFSIVLSIFLRLHIIDFFSNGLLMFKIPYEYSKGILCGVIELTNGVNLVSTINTKMVSNLIAVIAFLLGFGGCSILLQVLSIVSKARLSIKVYVYGKILQGSIAVIYTLLFIRFIPTFKFDLPGGSGLVGTMLIWIFSGALVLGCIMMIVQYYNKKYGRIENKSLL